MSVCSKKITRGRQPEGNFERQTRVLDCKKKFLAIYRVITKKRPSLYLSYFTSDFNEQYIKLKGLKSIYYKLDIKCYPSQSSFARVTGQLYFFNGNIQFFLVQLDSLCFSEFKNIAHPVYLNVILISNSNRNKYCILNLVVGRKILLHIMSD
jgi:hypothetical protein